MTRHGVAAGAATVKTGQCGMPIPREGGGIAGSCDRKLWHKGKGECSTRQQRNAEREANRASTDSETGASR